MEAELPLEDVPFEGQADQTRSEEATKIQDRRTRPRRIRTAKRPAQDQVRTPPEEAPLKADPALPPVESRPATAVRSEEVPTVEQERSPPEDGRSAPAPCGATEPCTAFCRAFCADRTSKFLAHIYS